MRRGNGGDNDVYRHLLAVMLHGTWCVPAAQNVGFYLTIQICTCPAFLRFSARGIMVHLMLGCCGCGVEHECMVARAQARACECAHKPS